MLLIAGGAAVAAALGGLLLDDGVEDVEKAVQTGNLPGLNLSTSPLDEKTKLALKVAVALLALVGVSIGERERESGLQPSLQSVLLSHRTLLLQGKQHPWGPACLRRTKLPQMGPHCYRHTSSCKCKDADWQILTKMSVLIDSKQEGDAL